MSSSALFESGDVKLSRGWADLVLRDLVAWASLGLAAPVLLFPLTRPWLTIVMLAASAGAAIAGRVRVGAWRWHSPFVWPVAALGAMTLVATWISAFPGESIPKAAGIALGIWTMRTVAVTCRSPGALWLIVRVYCALGTAAIIGSMAATAWLPKIAGLASVSSAIPRIVGSLPGAAGGVHPNALAAFIVLVLPLVAALALDRGASEALLGARLARHRVAILGPVVGTLAGIWLLTQSRGGWLAGAAALFVLAALRSGVSRRIATAACVVALAALVLAGPGRVLDVLWPADTGFSSAEASGAGRVELWSRAVEAIGEHPLAGTGLNAFRRIVHERYPLVLGSPDFDVVHAHNQFLQVALDVGLIGLAAYVALLGLAARTIWRLHRMGDPATRALAHGIAGVLVGLHVFGLADAVALGAKIGLLFWICLGLLDAADRGSREGR